MHPVFLHGRVVADGHDAGAARARASPELAERVQDLLVAQQMRDRVVGRQNDVELPLMARVELAPVRNGELDLERAPRGLLAGAVHGVFRDI